MWENVVETDFLLRVISSIWSRRNVRVYRRSKIKQRPNSFTSRPAISLTRNTCARVVFCTRDDWETAEGVGNPSKPARQFDKLTCGDDAGGVNETTRISMENAENLKTYDEKRKECDSKPRALVMMANTAVTQI